MVRSVCLRAFDQDLVMLVMGSLEREGVSVMWGCEPQQVRRVEGGGEAGEEGALNVSWFSKDTGETHQGEWDTVLFATGRRPATHSLALPLAGVAEDGEGKVVVDEADRTSVPNVYAIGDAAKGRWELTPVAIEAGKRLSRRLFAGPKELMDYETVPTTVFTPLELAAVGLTGEKAIAEYGEESVQVYHAFYHPLEFYLPGREMGSCYVKLVCVGPDERVVGLHMTGPNAGEMMQGFAVAVKLGMTYAGLASTIGIHPTSAEEVVKLHITRASGKDPMVTAC
jgi:pyruvate/2-oxoglutarate dehydrogenase complex dihydrolipoamide dehydrogenase (E3) component